MCPDDLFFVKISVQSSLFFFSYEQVCSYSVNQSYKLLILICIVLHYECDEMLSL